jgi:preprotein translocase subunit SecD
VDAGYERATLTILDANVTTLIAALVLFQFGTGAVKGFAVTLSLGVLASLFTALFVSRMIFDYFLSGRKIKQLSI